MSVFKIELCVADVSQEATFNARKLAAEIAALVSKSPMQRNSLTMERDNKSIELTARSEEIGIYQQLKKDLANKERDLELTEDIVEKRKVEIENLKSKIEDYAKRLLTIQPAGY
jgi:hypothetical protein